MADNTGSRTSPPANSLFDELKSRFPEVPHIVVEDLMKKNQYVRERCIDALGRESNKYLGDQAATNLNSLHIGITIPQVGRQHSGGTRLAGANRSDSVESVNSVSSAGSSHNQGASRVRTPPTNVYYPSQMGYTPTTNRFMANQYMEPNVQQSNIMAKPPTLQHSSISYPIGYEEPSALKHVTSTPELGHYGSPYTQPYTANQFFGQQSNAALPGGSHSPQLHYPSQVNNWTSSSRPGQFSQGFPSTGSSNERYSPSTPSPGSHQGGFYGRNDVQYNPARQNSYAYGQHTPPSASSAIHQGGSESADTPPHGFVYPPSNLASHPVQPQTYKSQAYIPMDKVNSTYLSSIPQEQPYNPHLPSQVPAVFLPTVSAPQTMPYGPSSGAESTRYLVPASDVSYNQSLIDHQRSRMKKLMNDLQQGNQILQALKVEVGEKERAVMQYKRSRMNCPFPSADDVQRIRDTNRNLQVDIQLLTRYIDLANNGQSLLGVVDQVEDNFYVNIGTGQRGSIHSSSGSEDSSPRRNRPGVPPRRPPPPVPPPANPPPYSACVPPRIPPGPPESQEQAEGDNWSCAHCTFENHRLLMKCEICENPKSTPAGFDEVDSER